ncbi:response regulator transcription factor [bacterium]|nr:MAG: response regulator transcription factor [bacterium]
MNQIRVLLVDDHAIVREGFHPVLTRDPAFVVAGEAENATQALAQIEALQPDVVIMDITLPDMSGIEATRIAVSRRPELGVVMFSMHEDPIFALRARDAGARGYVTKASGPTELMQAIHMVAAGGVYLSRDIARRVHAVHSPDSTTGVGSLTPSQKDLVKLLAEGRSVKEIAHLLGLSAKTVANRQTILRKKLGAHTSIKLLEAARALGLAPPRH